MQTYIVYLSFFDMVFAFSYWTVFSVSHSTTNIWFLSATLHYLKVVSIFLFMNPNTVKYAWVVQSLVVFQCTGFIYVTTIIAGNLVLLKSQYFFY